MTLEEAIEHLRESLQDPNHAWSCESCKQEHQQLVVMQIDWLIELWGYRKIIGI